MKIWSLILLASLAQAAAPQQAPRGSLQGVVVRWGSSEPVPQAIVELRADTGSRPIASTATTDKGEFIFPGIAAGRYRLLATRPGFAPAEFGQRRPGGPGQPFTLDPGQQKGGLRFGMSQGATVFGRVLDRTGQPLPFADVRLEKMDYSGGRAGLVAVQSTITNDLGEYRIYWVTPGQYYLRVWATNNQNFGGTMLVNPNGADTTGATFGSTTRPTARVTRVVGLGAGEAFAPIYYPATPDVQSAQLLDLQAGMEFNANFTLLPVRTRAVRGNVVDQSTGQPLQGTLRASIYPVDRYLQTGGTTLQFNNGTFEFSDMRPGLYELGVLAGDFSGRLTVDVPDRDVDVSVRVSSATKVSGKLRVEGQPPEGFPATLAGAAQVVIRGSLSQLSSTVAATGDFEFPKVPVGSYQVGVQPFAPLGDLPLPSGSTPGPAPRARPPVPPIWRDAYIKSIRIGDRDILNGELLVEGQPLGSVEVVIGLNGASLDGRVLNSKQEPVPYATVALIPTGTAPIRLDRYRSVSTNENGQYSLRAVAPGDYVVYAWEDVDAGAWFNPAFARLYESFGQAVQVDEAQKRALDVHTVPAP
jgi:protocatechuate 3,4-dioxygenase beta subunit